jgi:uroporphyrinogen-III synthase
MPRTVWITRAEPGAEATAARVRALGHTAFVRPLLAVREVPAALDLAGVSALAFTSGNGVRGFADLTPERGFRVFAVGQATAAAARAAGFRTVLSADGGVDDLAKALIGRKAELGGGAVLHPGAAEPAGDLVGALQARGIAARGVTVYETVPAPWDEALLDALFGVDVVLIHSGKAARALAEVLEQRSARHLMVLGLSKAAIQPLSNAKVAAKLFPSKPLEDALLNLIDQEP